MSEQEELGFFTRLGAIGDRPEDTADERLKHRLVVFMGILMSGGGVGWGSAAGAFGLFYPAIIPWSYVLITLANLLFFWRTKNFAVTRAVQVLISLALPFLFQWSLGGFEASGVVMLWAMFALLGSLTFSEPKQAIIWVVLYVGLTIFSGVIEPWASSAIEAPPQRFRTLFYVANISIISMVVFGLSIYLSFQRLEATRALEEAHDRISALNESLEQQVMERTQELASNLAQSQAVLDQMADGLVAVDLENRVQVANPAVRKVLGRELRPGDSADELGENLAAIAQRAHAEGEVVREEVPLGGDRVAAVVASPILLERDDKASCVGAVMIVRDVTFEKQIDQMKTGFIATVSHELRTPLTSILGFAKTTRNRLEKRVWPHVPEDDKRAVRARDQASGNLQIIVSEGERLGALISDLLDISKMESGQMEWSFEALDPVSLVERVRASASALFHSGPVELEVQIEGELPEVCGDSQRLHQVLLNLLSNGYKFTEEGVVRLLVRAEGDAVRFDVVDQGVGIDPADHEAVFERFKQVGDTLTDRPQGTGLGLPICREIVLAHEGTIGVESELGQGATFIVRIPTADAVCPERSRTVVSKA